ncbi:SNF2-related protein [Plastorhodobacter daqingensis]|uniref:SNF2-related protein n=1 Tax=Plastorhodobacter daqingensis TaxID=1387281 RepID=A0ABW2UMQ9_9RHOB
MRPRSALRESQLRIYREAIDHPARLIVLKMSGGKTAAMLTAIRDMLDSFTIRKVLVIAPKLVAKSGWPAEIREWRHTHVLSYAVCVGSEAERRAALEQDVEITIVNKDVLPWLAKHLGTVKNWPWDCVIVDESSMFKAGKKRTTRARVKGKDGTVRVRKGGNMTRFGVLTTARKKISRIYLLTGTPAPNGVEDLWGQIYLLDQGERLGQSLTAFHQRWFDKNRYTHQITVKPGAEEEIMSRVQDVMISLPAEKATEDPIYIPVKVTLPEKVMKEYRDFERSLVSKPYDVEAVSKGVLANKLLQFSNGSMYREDGSVAAVHNEKLDALDEIIEQAAGDPILVFYSFKFDLEAIRKRHPRAVVLNECDDAVDLWNAGKIPILLAHPASCAHGLNMQYGGHIAVWFGLTWSLELYQQANARLPRPGQKHLVAIYQIIAEGTYDEVALEVLGRKGVTQDAVIRSTLSHFNLA